MSLVIRFAKTGRKGERKFRVVVKEKRSKRDGKAIDTLGFYEKRVNGETFEVNREKINYWISKGAKATPSIKKILEK